MRSSRLIVAFLTLAGLGLMSSPVGLFPNQAKTLVGSRDVMGTEEPRLETCASLIAGYHGTLSKLDMAIPGSSADDQHGIREDIPRKYRNQYEQWKKEFLSTEIGRSEWATYANNDHFKLTISMSKSNAEGATTGNYKWNEAGELVAATINLGVRLDRGFPNPVYFPVMNSLVPTESSHQIDGVTLAATKIAHEFGHVNRTAKVDPATYQLQSELIPQYNQIFLSNGHNPNDPRLVEFARRMGGTPVEVWEDREYWGETNAMLYLGERFADHDFRCLLFSRIKQRIDLYAKSYEQRFLNVAQSTPSGDHCGW
jgi:hypothetical protein